MFSFLRLVVSGSAPCALMRPLGRIGYFWTDGSCSLSLGVADVLLNLDSKFFGKRKSEGLTAARSPTLIQMSGGKSPRNQIPNAATGYFRVFTRRRRQRTARSRASNKGIEVGRDYPKPI